MREPGGVRDRSAAQPVKSPAERRKQPRAQLALRGRYLLADRREHVCTVVDASTSAVSVAAPERGKIGETMVIYFDDVGRIEGEVVRHTGEGFVLQLTCRSRAAAALAEMVERAHHAAKKGWGKSLG